MSGPASFREVGSHPHRTVPTGPYAGKIGRVVEVAHDGDQDCITVELEDGSRVSFVDVPGAMETAATEEFPRELGS